MAHKGCTAKASANGRSTVSGGPSLPWEDLCCCCLGPCDRCENSSVAQAVPEKSYERVWNLGRYVKTCRSDGNKKGGILYMWLIYVVWNVYVYKLGFLPSTW